MTQPNAYAPIVNAAETDLLYLLHDVARLLRREIDRRARRHDMNRPQWLMLVKLAANPGLSQKDLAEILEVEPMTVARLTDRLEARGLVERRADPRDRRIWRLHLTGDADPFLREIETERTAIGAFIAHDLTPALTAATIAGLSSMKTRLLAADRAADDHIEDQRVGVARPEKEIA